MLVMFGRGTVMHLQKIENAQVRSLTGMVTVVLHQLGHFAGLIGAKRREKASQQDKATQQKKNHSFHVVSKIYL